MWRARFSASVARDVILQRRRASASVGERRRASASAGERRACSSSNTAKRRRKKNRRSPLPLPPRALQMRRDFACIRRASRHFAHVNGGDSRARGSSRALWRGVALVKLRAASIADCRLTSGVHAAAASRAIRGEKAIAQFAFTARVRARTREATSDERRGREF